MTIAVSTIISAINALTMTPSRAVLIFKTEEGQRRPRASQREALPWWIFGVLGGVLTVWLGQTLSWPARLRPAGGAGGADAEAVSSGCPGPSRAVYFAPGVLVGGVVGWFIIRPVNAVLGWFFRGFNRLFDRMTALYGWTVGRVLRLSVIVLLVYGGLLVLTDWQFIRTPTGFIPQQDKGYLILNVQLPDSASVERTQRVMARIEELARETPGVAHTVGVSGQSLILNANAQPRLDVRHAQVTMAVSVPGPVETREQSVFRPHPSPVGRGLTSLLISMELCAGRFSSITMRIWRRSEN